MAWRASVTQQMPPNSTRRAPDWQTLSETPFRVSPRTLSGRVRVVELGTNKRRCCSERPPSLITSADNCRFFRFKVFLKKRKICKSPKFRFYIFFSEKCKFKLF